MDDQDMLKQFPKPPLAVPTFEDELSVEHARYTDDWANKFVVPLMRAAYADYDAALVRAHELAPIRNARFLRMFTTSRAFVAEYVPAVKP